MIKRIVKMVFRDTAANEFLNIFDVGSTKIRASEGCHYLELIRDTNDPRIFFTISIWENEEALNKYRNSDLFRYTWAATKSLFEEAPVVWSTETQRRLD